MPTENEIGAVEVIADMDTSLAESKAAGLMSKIQTIGNQMTGSAQSGFVAFGTTAANKLDTVTRSATAMTMAMGPESPLARVAPMLSTIDIGFQHIASAEQTAETGGRKFVALTPLMTGMGIAVAGIGMALTQLGAPLQRAQALWTTSVTNTGASVDDFKGQLSDAVAQSKQFGFSASDVTEALGKMTAQTKDPAEAFKELSFAETLAAATHTDVAKAADQVGRMHAGMFRSLRQFGIYLPQLRTSADGLAKSEQALTAATERYQKAQQALADFTTRTDAEMEKNKEAAADKVSAAQQTLSDAQTRYNDLAARYANDDQARQEQTAAAVEDSAQRQQDALQNLQDVRDRMDAKSSQSQETQMALADAEERVNAARVKVAETTGSARQQAIEEEKTAEEGLLRAKLSAADKDKQNQRDLQKAQEAVTSTTEAHGKAVLANTDAAQKTISDQHELERAAEQVAAAKDKVTDAEDKLATASSLTIAQQQEQARLQTEVTDATDKQADAQAKVTEQKDLQAQLDAQFQRGMEAFMQKEQGLLERREHTWAGHVAKLKAYLTDLLQSAGGLAPAAIGIGGIIAGTGQAISLGRGIGRLGKKIGGRLGGGGAGGAASEIESATEDLAFSGASVGRDPASGRFKSLGKDAEDMEKKVGGSLKNVGRDAKELEKVEKEGGKVSGLFHEMSTGAKLMGSNIIGTVSSFITAGVSIAAAGWAAIAPWLPLILAIGAVIAAGYLLYRNWDTIKDLLGVVWDWIFDKVKRIFGEIEGLLTGAVDWTEKHIKDIAFFFLAGGPLGLALDWLLGHWREVWDGIKKLGDIARDGIITGMEDLILGILKGSTLLVHELAKLPGPLGAPFKAADNVIKDLGVTILSTLDKLKSDGGRKANEIGAAISDGVSYGIDSGQAGLTDVAVNVVDTTAETMTTRAGISSPSKLFADRVGHPIAMGVVAGMQRGVPAIRAASQGLVHVPGVSGAAGTAPYQAPSPSAPAEGPHPPQGRGPVVGEMHQHFHQEISPLHAAAEAAWSLRDL